MQVKKQQLELVMKQQTGSKLGKEYVKALSSMYSVRYVLCQEYVNYVSL